MCSSCLSYFEYSNRVFFWHPFFAAIQRVTLQFLFIYYYFYIQISSRWNQKAVYSIWSHLLHACIAWQLHLKYAIWELCFPATCPWMKGGVYLKNGKLAVEWYMEKRKMVFVLASWGKKTELQAFPIRFSYITAVLYTRAQLSIIEFINKTLLMAIWAEWQWGVTYIFVHDSKVTHKTSAWKNLSVLP